MLCKWLLIGHQPDGLGILLEGIPERREETLRNQCAARLVEDNCRRHNAVTRLRPAILVKTPRFKNSVRRSGRRHRSRRALLDRSFDCAHRCLSTLGRCALRGFRRRHFAMRAVFGIGFHAVLAAPAFSEQPRAGVTAATTAGGRLRAA